MKKPHINLTLLGISIFLIGFSACIKNSTPTGNSPETSVDLGAGDSMDRVCGGELLGSTLCKDTDGKTVGELDDTTTAYYVLEPIKTDSWDGVSKNKTQISLSEMAKWKKGWSVQMYSLEEIQAFTHGYTVQVKAGSRNKAPLRVYRAYYDQNGKRIVDVDSVLSAGVSSIVAGGKVVIGDLDDSAFRSISKLYEVVYFGYKNAAFEDVPYYYIMPVIDIKHI